MERFDVVVIGAGAAGMMAAAEAGRRGRSVLVVDHAKAPGEKIRISGGGRCNFTNRLTTPEAFLSGNPRFCISALKRYSQWDFIALVERHAIAYHEKTLGQLFCDGSSRQIIDMLLGLLRQSGAALRLGARVAGVERLGEDFHLTLARAEGKPGRGLGEGASSNGVRVACRSLVVASGGKSIPKMGASGFGYDLARQFGLPVTETRPALVPLTFEPTALARLKALSGVAVDPARVACGKRSFDEAVLFTHRGLSGPAILQISSYWREGREIALDLAPGQDLDALLRRARQETPKKTAAGLLAGLLPKRLAQDLAEDALGPAAAKPLAETSAKALGRLAQAVSAWRLKPAGSEGYRTAEVTLGGVDTRALDSRTLQARAVPGLYFIGEVVDVTGWLGGYNFQWAWSSGWAAGQVA